MNRCLIAIIALMCLTSVGCVEGETTYTVNPDGSARIQIEVVSGMPLNFAAPPSGKNPDEETLDDLLRKAIRPTLEIPGIAAWKGVHAEFLPNGKMKFSGTAYVKRLEDFTSNGSMPFLIMSCSAKRDSNGALVLKGLKNNNDTVSPAKRKPKTPEEIRKMTDEDLDKHILRDLIELQSSKPLMRALLTDAKIKNTFILPGEITSTTGFVKDSNKASMILDGNKILDKINGFALLKPVELRKLYRGATTPDFFEHLIFEDGEPENGSITVAKPDKSLFDFDKEVAEAREAYPQLRKKFGFGDDLRLPMGNTPPKK
jgi:hypothetical protein